jgi:hypothetical protein
MDPNFLAYLQGRGMAFQKYAAGAKQYGMQGAPNVGPTNSPEGYDERDLQARMKRNAMLRRMQAGQQGAYMRPAWLQPGTSRSA